MQRAALFFVENNALLGKRVAAFVAPCHLVATVDVDGLACGMPASVAVEWSMAVLPTPL